MADSLPLHHELTGAGPPAVLTAGIGQTSAVWASLAASLSSRHRTLTWDYRGHGRSAACEDPADYGPQAALADLLSMMALAGVDEAHKGVLIGHSLGGYLSLRAALEAPRLTKALVLIATGPGFRDAAARERWNLHARSITLDEGVHPAARQMSFQLDGRVMEGLASIEAPTLVIVGGEDRRFIGAKDYLTRKMPHATALEVSGAKHAVHVTHAPQVNEAIAAFLREL